LVITALATVFSVVAQAKEKPIYAGILAVTALLISASVYYRPVVALTRKAILRAHRNRVARKSWTEFLRFEKRFGNFINKNDTGNLRGILSAICNQNPDELTKLCPPDYVNVFYPLLSKRHEETTHVQEPDFRRAVSEFCAMVASYNTDYVLGPLRRLRDGQLFAQIPSQNKKHWEEGIEDFRERWVRFLDDFKEFVDKTNNELRYEPYHEAINSYFERPKKLSS